MTRAFFKHFRKKPPKVPCNDIHPPEDFCLQKGGHAFSQFPSLVADLWESLTLFLGFPIFYSEKYLGVQWKKETRKLCSAARNPFYQWKSSGIPKPRFHEVWVILRVHYWKAMSPFELTHFLPYTAYSTSILWQNFRCWLNGRSSILCISKIVVGAHVNYIFNHSPSVPVFQHNVLRVLTKAAMLTTVEGCKHSQFLWENIL